MAAWLVMPRTFDFLKRASAERGAIAGPHGSQQVCRRLIDRHNDVEVGFSRPQLLYEESDSSEKYIEFSQYPAWLPVNYCDVEAWKTRKGSPPTSQRARGAGI
jgi:hypothetical protein